MTGTVKKILSYIYDFPIEKRQSQFSGNIVVSLHRGQFKLSTKNAIYSFGKNYTSFSEAFKAIHIRDQKIKSVLVIGFGLGSVVDLLEDHPSIQSIAAIDADEVIVELAGKYLQSAIKNKVELICCDAETFVSAANNAYDLVLFDVFIDDETPMPFIREEFLKQLKKLVNKDGILLYSKIEVSVENKIENDRFQKIFSEVFPRSFSIETDSNKMYTWWNKQG